MFYNEVLGESYDTASKLVTLTELDKVSNLGPNTIPHAKAARGRYMRVVMGVDWGGGGAQGVSFTTVAIVGMKHDGCIDVIFGKRLLTPHDHIREAKDIRQLWDVFRPDILAHDYTGAGALRETFLIQSGINSRHVMPCQMVRAASQKPCYHVPPSEVHPRSHYRVDKSRTLLLTCAMIRGRQLHFFDRDYISQEDAGLIRDFLALTEEKTKTAAAGEIYRIDRLSGFSDDFAQAVNLGCVALWHRSQQWPDISELANYIISDEQLRAATLIEDSDWEDELFPSNYQDG